MADPTKDTESPAFTMGKLGFSVSDLAVRLEMDEAELYAAFRERKGEIYRQYMQGRLAGREAVRKTVMESALKSSSPMLLKMTEYYQRSEKENMNIWED